MSGSYCTPYWNIQAAGGDRGGVNAEPGGGGHGVSHHGEEGAHPEAGVGHYDVTS